MSIAKSLLAALLVLAAGAAQAAPRPVVLELFTSNSCSSCPPAYTLLHSLQSAASPDGIKLIRLDEHVDYWNQLDWVDRYSDAAFTQRQQVYARDVFGSDQVYTPQLVVDGRHAMVGSNSRAVREAIAESAGRADWPVSLSLDPSHADSVSVDVVLAPHSASNDARVWLALTQDHVVSHVGAGENGGRTLHEDGIVRVLKPIARLTASSSSAHHYNTTLALPSQVAHRDLAVVAFIQQQNSHAIVGAASRRLKSQ